MNTLLPFLELQWTNKAFEVINQNLFKRDKLTHKKRHTDKSILIESLRSIRGRKLIFSIALVIVMSSITCQKYENG